MDTSSEGSVSATATEVAAAPAMGRATIVVTPAEAAGRGLLAARRMRLTAHDGELVLTHRDGSSERLCSGSELRHAVHVDGYGSHWILSTERQAWKFPDEGWTDGGTLGFLTHDTDTAGTGAIAAAFGVPVTFADVDAGGSPIDPDIPVRTIDPRPRRSIPMLVLRVLCLATWAVVLPTCLVAEIFVDLAPGVWDVVRGMLMGTPLAWLVAVAATVAWDRLLARRLFVPPVPPGAVVLHPLPAGPYTRAFRRNAWLLVSPEVIAVRTAFGIEAWRPGPRVGGANLALVVGRPGAADRQIQLTYCASTYGVLTLPVRDWAATEAAFDTLCDVLRNAGIDVVPFDDPVRLAVDSGLTALPDRLLIRGDLPRVIELTDLKAPLWMCFICELFTFDYTLNLGAVVFAIPLLATLVMVAQHFDRIERLSTPQRPRAVDFRAVPPEAVQREDPDATPAPTDEMARNPQVTAWLAQRTAARQAMSAPMKTIELEYDEDLWIKADLHAIPAAWVPRVVRARWAAQGLPADKAALARVEAHVHDVAVALVLSDPPAEMAMLLHPRADDRIVAVGTVRIEPVAASATADDVLDGLVAPETLLEGPAEIGRIDTRSGSALRVRQRHRGRRRGLVRPVVESLAYAWFETDEDGVPVVVLMTSTVEDLTAAGEIWPLFDELAATMAVVERDADRAAH